VEAVINPASPSREDGSGMAETPPEPTVDKTALIVSLLSRVKRTSGVVESA
jgi:hypothetical protein